MDSHFLGDSPIDLPYADLLCYETLELPSFISKNDKYEIGFARACSPRLKWLDECVGLGDFEKEAGVTYLYGFSSAKQEKTGEKSILKKLTTKLAAKIVPKISNNTLDAFKDSICIDAFLEANNIDLRCNEKIEDFKHIFNEPKFVFGRLGVHKRDRSPSSNIMFEEICFRTTKHS